MKEADAARQKKFVRVTAKEIINPALVPITFDLYLVSGDKAEFLGSVAPYPANHPGSFIIATGNKLDTGGVLELRLTFPREWNRHDRLGVKISRLTLE